MNAVHRMWMLCKSRSNYYVLPNDTLASAKCQSSFGQMGSRAEASPSGCLPRFPLLRAPYCYYWF